MNTIDNINTPNTNNTNNGGNTMDKFEIGDWIYVPYKNRKDDKQDGGVFQINTEKKLKRLLNGEYGEDYIKIKVNTISTNEGLIKFKIKDGIDGSEDMTSEDMENKEKLKNASVEFMGQAMAEPSAKQVTDAIDIMKEKKIPEAIFKIIFEEVQPVIDSSKIIKNSKDQEKLIEIPPYWIGDKIEFLGEPDEVAEWAEIEKEIISDSSNDEPDIKKEE